MSKQGVFSPFSSHRGPRDYLDVILSRRVPIITVLLSFILLSFVAFLLVPRQFRSTAVVLVQAENVPSSALGPLQTNNDIEVDNSVLTRLRTVPQEVVATPRLEQILEELNPYPEYAGTSPATMVAMLRRRTLVEIGVNDSFTIAYTDTDPERAQKIAARLASLFINEQAGMRARDADGAADFIEERIEEARKQLKEKENAIRTLKERYVNMMPERLADNIRKLEELRVDQQARAKEVKAAVGRRDVLDRQLAVQLQMNSPGFRLLPESSVGNALASPKSQQLNSDRLQLTELRKRYAGAHPEVKALEKRIERLERELADSGDEEQTGSDKGLSYREALITTLKAQKETADRELEKVRKQEEEVSREIRDYQHRIANAPAVEQELQRLTRDYDMLSLYYSDLLNRELLAETSGAAEKQWKGDQFRIVDPPRVPEEPSFPNLYIFLGAGLILGLGGGIAMAFALEWLDHTIKDEEELKALLPYPLLVAIPHVPEEGLEVQQARDDLEFDAKAS